MFGSGHLISGLNVATGTFALTVLAAGVVLVGLGVLAMFLIRSAGQSGIAGALWGCALALVGAMFAYALFDRSNIREQSAERRALEERAAELAARTLTPGSALGCLDEIASSVLEDACQKPLFANAEAVAAAVSYVDARLSLLPASILVAQREPTFQPVLERLRRGLEADRFGVVAHVLSTRGCTGIDCPELRMFRDPTRIAANMKGHTFEVALAARALNWPANGAGGPAVASSAAPSGLGAPPALPTLGAGPGGPAMSALPPGGGGTSGGAKYDYPTASSIPAVSIMNAEPGAPPEPDAKPAPKRMPARKTQTARDPAAAPQQRPAPSESAPAQEASPAPATPQTSGSR